MIVPRWTLLLAVLGTLDAALATGCSRRPRPIGKGTLAAPPARPPSRPASTRAGREKRKVTGPPRFIAVGGGATPESTEVSLEQDIDLVERTFPGPGVVLFAGGAGSLSVRELDPSPHGDTLLVALGELFHPRVGRRSRYRAVSLDAERASLDGVEEQLSASLSEGSLPLLLYIAAHGDQGDAPRDNSVALWGGRPLTVARLAQLDEKHARPLRLVVTSCFSGGFAELAFAHADEHAGPSLTPRCGLFAGTWDRETSGCDANPDRRAQESYGLHFIHALEHADRAGQRLDPKLVDFDGDGKVGLLEAHTRARIAALSLDVPTSTSDRWLRSVERGGAPIDRKLLPEEAAVVDQLGAALGLRDEAAVEKHARELDARLSDLSESIRLLERWPLLDDAFHPDFAEALRQHRSAIREVLDRSPEAAARATARAKVDGMDTTLADLEVEEARLLRLQRAYETLHKASALMRRGGSAARYYATLLACERAVP